ncbi:hypothetical protein MBLNU457_7414t1 [Dothideomycetes sp. NU457]
MKDELRNTSQTRSVPQNWPSDIKYITSPTYTAAVSPELQRKFNTPTQTTASWPKISASPTPNNNVVIQPITNITHPARGQYGLFATQPLAPNTFILPYLGTIHTNEASDTDETSNYDLSLDRDMGLSIDATTTGNEARFINDYRGVAEAPNAEFRDCWVQIPAVSEGVRGTWERRMGVFVLGAGKTVNRKRRRGIVRGEEVVVNYGKGFWKERKGEGGVVEEADAVNE